LASMPDLASGEIVNVGSAREISINDLARLVIDCAQSQSSIEHIPYKEAYGSEFEDIRHRRPNLSKLHQLTGYEHSWNLEATLKDLIHRARHLRLGSEPLHGHYALFRHWPQQSGFVYRAAARAGQNPTRVGRGPQRSPCGCGHSGAERGAEYSAGPWFYCASDLAAPQGHPGG